MSISRFAAVTAVAALMAVSASSADARERHYRRHHDGSGAAVGAALGAGIVLGALAASSANAREEIYVEPEPAPPPPPALYGRPDYRDRGEEANQALAACRVGLLNAARRYGAYDAEIGDIYSVRETGYGHRVSAEITIDYPEGSRTSNVTCETEDGLLVSARSEY